MDQAAREIDTTLHTQRAATTDTAATPAPTSERLVSIAERRAAIRVPIETTMRAVLMAGGADATPVETVTVNISTSGALLRAVPGLGDGPWQIELFLPGQSTPVRASATLAPRTEGHVGVAFGDVTAADATRLENVVVGPALAGDGGGAPSPARPPARRSPDAVPVG